MNSIDVSTYRLFTCTCFCARFFLCLSASFLISLRIRFEFYSLQFRRILVAIRRKKFWGVLKKKNVLEEWNFSFVCELRPRGSNFEGLFIFQHVLVFLNDYRFCAKGLSKNCWIPIVEFHIRYKSVTFLYYEKNAKSRM